jgi:hypothetical protein
MTCRFVAPGDHIFVISGKVPNTDQYLIGGFRVRDKVSAEEAYRRLPHNRLGVVRGNINVDDQDHQHPLDIQASTSLGSAPSTSWLAPLHLSSPHLARSH